MKMKSLLKSIIRSLTLGVMLSCPLWAQSDFGYVLQGNNSYITQINLNSKSIAAVISTGKGSSAGTLNQRGTKLWVSAGNNFFVVNTQTKSITYQSPSFSSTVTKPVFSPDGSKAYLLVYSNPTTLMIFDTVTYTGINSIALTTTSSWRSAPVLSRDGNKLYFIDNDSYINEVNTATFAVKRAYVSSSSYNSLKLSPDDSLLFIWGANQYIGSIQVLKTSALTTFSTITTYSYVSNLDLSKDGKALFVGPLSSTLLQKIDISSFPATSSTYFTLPISCYDVAVDPTDTLIYVTYGASVNNTCGIYSTKTGQSMGNLAVYPAPSYLIMPLRKDTVAPALISDCKAIVRSYNSIRLTFTSPGNDGMVGRAMFYDIRYDTVRISDASFKQAKNVIGIQSPQAAGKIESIDITGLKASTQYYFAIRAGDEILNLSPITTVSAATPTPAHIKYQLSAIPRAVKDNDSLTLALNIQNTGGEDLVYHASLFGIEKIENHTSVRMGGTVSGVPQGRIPAASTLSKSASSGVSVLMVFAGASSGAYDVQQKLMAQGGFSKVDIYYASTSTPTLDVLKQYDVIFVWSNDYFNNSTAIGNVLADYVDAGGNVVTALFSLGSASGSSIQGRFNSENYWAIVPGPYTSSTRATLGTVKDPNHPIMKGVRTFDGGFSASRGSYRILGGSVTTGTSVIASWSDGSALVAVRRLKGTNRVDLGFEPSSSDVYPECWVSSTDGAKLMANALKFSALSYYNSGMAETIVALAPDSGTVKSGEIKTVTATIQTKNTSPGDYGLTIAIETNDPDSSFGLASVNYTVHDVTPPAIAIRFFQNEAFPENLSIISVAHEKLYSPIMKAGINGESVQQTLFLIDTSNFVYNVNYTLTKSGMLSVQYDAMDSIGNRSLCTRQLNVQQISANTTAMIVSTDQQASLHIQANLNERPLFVTASVDAEDSEQTIPDAIGPVYHFSPQSFQLNTPAELTIGFKALSLNNACSHLGVYTRNGDGKWMYVPTRIDVQQKVVHAQVHSLGDFRLINDASIQPEGYVEAIPAVVALEQNYPNPFNPTTVINYQIPVASHVRLTIYDAIGREVAILVNEVKLAGYYSVEFNASKLSGGVYFARLQSGETIQSKKLVLIK